MKRSRLNPISAKRRKENRERRQVVIATFGQHPACRFPGCTSPADDAHELLSRARGGSITDVAGIIPLCRSCHTWVTENPSKAERLGLSTSRHGGDAA